MTIGERIKELRKQNNISQVQLAKTLGISRQAVSKWENDLAEPDTLNLIRLADILSTDSEFIATGNHSKIKAAPTVVTMIQKVDNIVEKVVEVEKIVEVERIVEKSIEVPRIKKITRIKYLRNPLEFAAVGLIGFILGILVGLII